MAIAMTSKRQLSISLKILLVSLCFSLPIVVLAYFVVDNIDQNSRIAELEASGDAYQTPLVALLRDTMEHQRLMNHCPAGVDCKSKLAALENNVKGSFAALKAVDLKYGTQLEFTPDGLSKRKRQLATRENLEASWLKVTDAVKQAGGTVPSELNARYDDVNTVINTMITHLGDTSTLILDPELDTYYTMDITLLALPQNLNRIERMIADARKAFVNGTFTVEDRMTLAANAALLQTSDIDRVMGDVQTALNENKNEFHDAVDSFQKTLPVISKEWVDANARLVALTKELATSASPTVTFDQYTDVAVKARESAFKFWNIVTPENDNLFKLRVDYYTGRRNVSLLLSAVALLFSCFIAYLVTRSMIVPLNKLTLTLKPGATLLLGSVDQISQTNAPGKPSDPTTTTIICEELKAHADDMKQTAQNLEVLVFGRVVNPD